ncbi:class I adenylate-forming enzyme family protein [Nocardia aurantiaca]|nr:acyl-CoA synthetase [Nocardia aurantiaca]
MTADTRGEEIAFATSGSTGSPARWWRTVVQIRAEVALVAAELGAVGQIVNFAPTGHLYGHLYGTVLPELIDVPVHHGWRHPAAVPNIRTGTPTLLVCLPSSWPIVRSMAAMLAGLPSVTALHGTGPVTAAARTTAERLASPRFHPVEIFGSTETGAIATRTIAAEDNQPWTLLPDVQLITDRNDGPQPLHVRSPRLARHETTPHYPQALHLDDLVEPLPHRRFRHLGRVSRLIKVNGVRCNLDQIEASLHRLHSDSEFACVAATDELRGEHYDLYYSSPPSGPGTREIWSSFQQVLGSSPLPRRIHRVETLRRSATGKVLADQLYERNRPETHRQETTSRARQRVRL